MEISFSAATRSDVRELAALHNLVADHLTRKYGPGLWSSRVTERGVLASMRLPKFSKTLIAGENGRILGTLRLHTKKPWAIDTTYFTAFRRPLYLTAMAVLPEFQRQGLGRRMMKQAEVLARDWPADVIRLDAYNAEAGAATFYKKCGFREMGLALYKGVPLVYLELVL